MYQCVHLLSYDDIGVWLETRNDWAGHTHSWTTLEPGCRHLACDVAKDRVDAGAAIPTDAMPDPT